jgi:hypothetical protein
MSNDVVWTEAFLREQLARTKERIAEHHAAVNSLHDERKLLEGILAGPRVQPMLGVWQHFNYDEEEVDSIEAGMSMAETISDHGFGAPVGVFVGGAFIPWGKDFRAWTDDDVAEALVEHRAWEMQQREEAS